MQQKEKRIIVHIGYPKTGTTFLQEQVFPKLENVCFLRGAHQLRKLYLQEINYDTIFISDEALIGDYFKKFTKGNFFEDFKAKMDLIRDLFNDPIILVSFRQHSEFLWSLYKQYLNQGGVIKDFSDFFNLENTGFLKQEDLLFDKHFSYLQENFTKVVAFDYAMLKKENKHASLEKLLERLALKLPPNINYSVRQNVGISTAFQKKTLVNLNILNSKIGNLLNRGIFRRRGLTPRTIASKFGKLVPSKKIELAPSIKHAIEANYQEDWERVQQKLTIK